MLNNTLRHCAFASVVAASVLLGGFGLWAQSRPEAAPYKFTELRSIMCKKGELLLSESFDADSFAKDWRKGAGDWTVESAGVKVREKAEDGHHPYVGHKLEVTDCIIQFAFKFDGASSIFVGLDRPGAHVCRAVITPKSFRIQLTTGIGPTTKSTVIDEMQHEFEPGKWYTMLIEVHGKEMLAQVDNKCVAFGQIDGIEVGKTQLQLMSTGPWAWYDEVRVWEAKPSNAWLQVKSKLSAKKKKRC